MSEPFTVNGRPVRGAMATWGPILFGAIFFFGSCIWLAPVVAGGLLWPLIGFVMFAAAGGYMMSLGIRRLLAASAFQEARVDSRGPALLGGQVSLEVVLTPKKALTVKAATLTFKCVEQAIYSAGTDSRTYTVVLHEEALPMSVPQNFSVPFQTQLSVPVPPGLPASWEGRHNSFRWSVDLHLDLDGWPDLDLSTDVKVLPELARG